MKRLFVFLCMFVLVAYWPGMVGATLFTITDEANLNCKWLDSDSDVDKWKFGLATWLEFKGDYIEYTHSFDYDPENTEILGGSLTLTFAEYDGDRFKFFWEFGSGFAGDQRFRFGEIDTGPREFPIGADLLKDGSFNIRIRSDYGNFWLCSSTLTVECSSSPVPEPATIALLGMGLVGMAAAFRRKKA